MNCKFETLYFDDDGYVVRCKECKHYQLAFMSTMLTLSEQNFHSLRKIARSKVVEAGQSIAEHCRNVIIQTPVKEISIILTRKEANRFSEILEEADNEIKTQALFDLFTA